MDIPIFTITVEQSHIFDINLFSLIAVRYVTKLIQSIININR
jgi:hypothetical protein